MLSQIILVLAAALISSSTTYLFCKANEKTTKFELINNCKKEIEIIQILPKNESIQIQAEPDFTLISHETVSNQIKAFLNDLNTQINQKILQKYVFVMCQDKQLKDPNNLSDINALESFTNKSILKISEAGYNNFYYNLN